MTVLDSAAFFTMDALPAEIVCIIADNLDRATQCELYASSRFMQQCLFCHVAANFAHAWQRESVVKPAVDPLPALETWATPTLLMKNTYNDVDNLLEELNINENPTAGFSALRSLLCAGHVCAADWLLETLDMRQLLHPECARLLRCAADNGQIASLNWILRHWQNAPTCELMLALESAFTAAVSSGHISTAEWIMDNHAKSLRPQRLWGVAPTAAKICPDLILTINNRFGIPPYVFLEIVQTCEYAPTFWFSTISNKTTWVSPLPILQWMHACHSNLISPHELMSAFKCGWLDVMQWLSKSFSCEFSTFRDDALSFKSAVWRALDHAAWRNDIPAMEWLFSNFDAGTLVPPNILSDLEYGCAAINVPKSDALDLIITRCYHDERDNSRVAHLFLCCYAGNVDAVTATLANDTHNTLADNLAEFLTKQTQQGLHDWYDEDFTPTPLVERGLLYHTTYFNEPTLALAIIECLTQKLGIFYTLHDIKQAIHACLFRKKFDICVKLVAMAKDFPASSRYATNLTLSEMVSGILVATIENDGDDVDPADSLLSLKQIYVLLQANGLSLSSNALISVAVAAAEHNLASTVDWLFTLCDFPLRREFLVKACGVHAVGFGATDVIQWCWPKMPAAAKADMIVELLQNVENHHYSERCLRWLATNLKKNELLVEITKIMPIDHFISQCVFHEYGLWAFRQLHILFDAHLNLSTLINWAAVIPRCIKVTPCKHFDWFCAQLPCDPKLITECVKGSAETIRDPALLFSFPPFDDVNIGDTTKEEIMLGCMRNGRLDELMRFTQIYNVNTFQLSNAMQKFLHPGESAYVYHNWHIIYYILNTHYGVISDGWRDELTRISNYGFVSTPSYIHNLLNK